MSINNDLGLAAHLALSGRLRFFRSAKATILFGRQGDGVYRKLCHITFNKKSGAIYAQFTYFRTDPGVVGLFTSKIAADGSSSINWKSGGKVATNLVKYSHPVDGRAHFSQDGSHVTQFRTSSLNLLQDSGRVFEIHAFHLEPFEALKKKEATGKRLYLPFQSEGLPAGVSLSAEWARLDDVRHMADPGQPIAGPVALIPRRRDGRLYKAVLLAPPETCPVRNHLLLLNVHPLSPPMSITSPLLFFMGGWRKEDTFTPGTEASYLTFAYPVSNAAAMATTLGVADYRPNSE